MKSVIYAKISRLIYPQRPPFMGGHPMPVFIKTLVTENYDESKVFEIMHEFNTKYPMTVEFRVDIWIKGRRGWLESRRYNLSEV